jgi:hypothetical protein
MENIKDIKQSISLEVLNERINRLENKDRSENKISRFIPIITTMIAISGFLWGIYVFLQQRREEAKAIEVQNAKENKIRILGLQKVFWDKRLVLYEHLINSASQLSVLDIDRRKQLLKEKDNFDMLLRGHLSLYGDTAVIIQAYQFNSVFNEYFPDHPENQSQVVENAKKLTNACWQSLNKIFETQ